MIKFKEKVESMMVFLMCLFLGHSFSWSSTSGYLNAQDQKYYKNDSFEGNNQRERIDSTVKEINKIYSELERLKTQVSELNKEVNDLKQKNK
jgi:peptidoglycan hydrolase CwlO-like protein